MKKEVKVNEEQCPQKNVHFKSKRNIRIKVSVKLFFFFFQFSKAGGLIFGKKKEKKQFEDFSMKINFF
jgi:hypothetical protein